MARRPSILLFLIYLLGFCFSGTPAVASSDIPFVVAPSSTLGRRNIDVDLLKLQRLELKKAQSGVLGKKTEIVSSRLQKKNKTLIDEMNNFAKLEAPKGLSQEQAGQILDLMRDHPVVGIQALRKYDTWNHSIGFCFGRAAFVHWELLRRGVKPESIGKIFLIGNLKVDLKTGAFWEYHMATVVRDQNQSWWVIDPLVNQILNVEDWMQAMKAWALNSKQPEFSLYFADAIKMLPIPGAYSSEKLFFPDYRGYFKDLFDWFRQHPSQPNEGLRKADDRIEILPKLDHLFVNTQRGH